MTSLPQECNIAIPYCIAIQFRRPIRFKVCFTAGCGHAITCKPSHSDQSEPRFAWACQQLCACAVEREPRIQPKFTRPFSSFWGWGLGTRLSAVVLPCGHGSSCKMRGGEEIPALTCVPSCLSDHLWHGRVPTQEYLLRSSDLAREQNNKCVRSRIWSTT